MPTLNNAANGIVPKALHKIGNERIHNGVRRAMPLLKTKLIPEKETDGDPIMNISSAGNASREIVVDGDTISHGGPTKTQVRVHGVNRRFGLQIGIDAVASSRGKRQVLDHLKTELEDEFDAQGAMMSADIYGLGHATNNGVVTSGAVTSFDVDELYSLEPGVAYEWLDASASFVSLGVITVTSVDWTGTAPYTVTCTGTLSGAGATGDLLATQGHDISNEVKRFYSLSDAVSSTTSMYGLAAGGIYNFLGISKNQGGNLTSDTITSAEAERFKKSKHMLAGCACDPFIEEEYSRLKESQVDFVTGGSMDVRDHSRLTFRGQPVVVDPNAPPNKFFMIGKKEAQLNVHRKFSLDGFNGKVPPQDMTAFLSETEWVYKVGGSGKYQLQTPRQGIAVVSGITLT